MNSFSKGFFLLVFSIFLLFTISALKTEINIDVVDLMPYIDYTLPFDSNFSINLPDFSSLIYSKALPEDINYKIEGSKLTVFDNKKGTIVLKYQGTKFLEGIKTFEKTLDFQLINNTKIVLNTDENIEKLSPEPILEENCFVWNTNENNELVYISLKKNPFDIRIIILITTALAIILFLVITIVFKKYKTKNLKNNLFLDSTQKNILDLVKLKKILTQQEIANSLNIKKSNMSKILNKMERNNLIERKKVGKVNKISLFEKKEK